MSKIDFRPYVPNPGESNIFGKTARAHAKSVFKRTRIKSLFENWNKLKTQPFKGITTDGVCEHDLFSLGSEPYRPSKNC